MEARYQLSAPESGTVAAGVLAVAVKPDRIRTVRLDTAAGQFP